MTKIIKSPLDPEKVHQDMDQVQDSILNAKAQLSESLLFAYMCETRLGLDAIEEKVGSTKNGGIKTWFAPKVIA